MISRVLDGITPSGNALHIGNYFGAVKPNIELQQNVKDSFYFIADLHALTTVQNKLQLEDNIVNLILDYLALGLDPNKSAFYRQSDVSANSELAVILGNYISFSHMQRMHAYKDKLGKDSEADINMGLFNYPILMAADILLYKPEYIPVGEDQRQHVELTRDIAENFNKKYKTNLFVLPKPYISKETGKIVGTDGKRKMSKSLGNIIGIFDDEAVIRKQIMSCYTDPTRIKATDPGHVEGNPVFIYHDLLNENTQEVAELKSRYVAGTVSDVEVKEKLIIAHLNYFKEARQKRIALKQDLDVVKEILVKGAEKARFVANATLAEVQTAIGIKNSLSA